MDATTCMKNLTGCLTSIGLKLCDTNKDICLEHGVCVTSNVSTPIPYCLCYPCYYGDTCEKEMFSKNLWMLGQPPLKPQMLTASKIIFLTFRIIQILNCLLCLQTYFSSKKIRITNIGVYLIFNSIISLLLSLEEFISAILSCFIERLSERYLQIECLIHQKFVLISLSYIWGWSYCLIALERMLVECYHYDLFDTRKRSLIVSTFIFIICPLTTIPGIFTVKELAINEAYPDINKLLMSFNCVNYTPLGYTIYKVILSLHIYGTFLSYVLLCLFVFAHILRHRRRIASHYTILQNIRLILRNHRDFFIPLIVGITFFSIPMIVINEIMTCSKAWKFESLPYLMFVFGGIFNILPMSFSFFFFIYPANVYMVAFWHDSPVGQYLMRLKKKIKNIL